MIKGACAHANNIFKGTKRKMSVSSVPICEWLWEASFAEGGEVQGVWLLVHPTRLDVQVLEYVHFALETNLKHECTQGVSRV